MFIVQAFVRFGTYIVHCVRNSCFNQNQRQEDGNGGELDNEGTSLLATDSSRERLLSTRFSFSQHSLTSQYQDFSHSWRAAWLCILHVSVYYTMAIVAFSFVLEKWPIIDSAYFATVIFTTIGYGDLKPTSQLSEAFTICLALYGIVLLGVFLGMAGGEILDGHNEAVEKSRRKLRSMIMGSVAKKGHEPPGQASVHLSDSVLEEVRDPTLIEEILKVVMLEAPIVAFVIVLVVIAGHYEGWDMFDSVYYAVVTGTTIGFGDFSPHTPGVRLACCFVLPLSVAVLGEFLARVASVYICRQTRKTDREFLGRAMTLADLETMDTDRDGKVQKGEFLAFMLVALQKCDKSDIDDLLSVFYELDVSNTGEVSKADVYARSPNSSRTQVVHVASSAPQVPEGDL